ncbi:RHS repeat-associated core domain-containing protein [Sorangium sp. So ce367]|uniref:RHS repeat domain-containing protein n=1 Tax=Sorangium sp. So ce367 TaxID=3133305 RepID=UPI003F61CA76
MSGEEETAYHDQHLTLRDGRFVTKHIYAGQTRIASKMDPDWFRDPPTLYYHPDHLGSTSFASNNEQTLTQRDEYFPSGELWIDASDSRYELRRAYVFTGKELDQATGLYYFGARYYDPRSSVWLSPDPILDEYMGGGTSGGVFNPGNLGLYSYTLNNPVNLVDPDGRQAQGGHRNFPPGANGCRHPSCFNGPEGGKFHQEQMLQRMNAGSAAAAAGRTSRGIGDTMRRVLFRAVMQQQAARPPAQPAAAPAQPPQAAPPAKAAQPAPAAKPPQGAEAANPSQAVPPAQPSATSSKGGGAGSSSSAKRAAASMRRVGEVLDTVDDVMANPNLLDGMKPQDLMLRLGGKPPGNWRVEKLAHGKHAGQGFMLRQYNSGGKPTGRMIQWHPGGGHHGPQPYWKVNAGHSPVRVGPQF